MREKSRVRLRFLTIGAVVAGLLVSTGCAVPQTSTAEKTLTGPCAWAHELKQEYPLGERVTFALADAYGNTNVQITHCEKTGDSYRQLWESQGYTGKAGFARPGPVYVNSFLTPTGSYTVTEAFGRENPGTSLAYQELNQDSFWGGHRDANFNKYFEGPGNYPDESLWKFMRAGDYEQAAVINYNRLPDEQPVHGETFAIFLHAGMSETWGCISTDLSTVEKYLRGTQAGDRIVMGVSSELFNDSVDLEKPVEAV